MAREPGTQIRLRFVVEAPVPGVTMSLQDKDDAPLRPQTSRAGEALSFEFSVRVAPGPRFLGEFVRREGPDRRFVYLRVGQSAGQGGSPHNGRVKVDIHDIPAPLIEAAIGGKLLEARLIGSKNGNPRLATVKVEAWRAV